MNNKNQSSVEQLNVLVFFNTMLRYWCRNDVLLVSPVLRQMRLAITYKI